MGTQTNLKVLLKLGYEKNNGAFSHPTIKVLFVGDYIDRGPKLEKHLKLLNQWLIVKTLLP